MTDLHLYKFTESGFFAARDRDHAVALVMQYVGIDASEAMGEFHRDVPDDEAIEVSSEESWDNPNERVVEHASLGRKYNIYYLTKTALEHANAHGPEFGGGYCFGGVE